MAESRNQGLRASPGGISPEQLRALQTLYGIHARRSLDVAGADPRAERLAWASRNIGRALGSFTELRRPEAEALLNSLRGELGEGSELRRRPRDRYTARAAGTHGRRGRVGNDQVMATRQDTEAIDELRERLGWSQEQLAAWLSSSSSPIRGQASPTLRTWSDCNRVRWALKAMLKRAGKWRSRSRAVA